MRTLFTSSVSALVLAASISTIGEAQTRVSRSDAQAAIAAMGLDASDTNEISFERGRFARGDYVFTNVVFHIEEEHDDEAGEEGDFNVSLEGEELRVDEMRFSSPRLAPDGRVMFDAFSMSGLNAAGDDGESVVIDLIEIVGPNADFAAMIAEGFATIGEGDEDDVDFDIGDDPFDRLALNGLRVSDTGDDETTVNLGSLVLEHDADDEVARFEMNDFLVDAMDDDGPIRISLSEIRMEGISTETTGEWFTALENDNMPAFMNSYMNAATVNPASIFSEFILRDFAFNGAGLDLSLASITAENEVRRGNVHSSGIVDRLHFSADAESENGAQIAAGLMMLGYSELNMNAVTNTVFEPERGRAYTTGDNYYLVEDAFRIDFSQDLEGYNEYTALMAELISDAAENGDDAAEEAAMAAMSALQVNEFSVSISDESILERAFGAMAAQQGIAPEQARAQASALVLLGAASAGPLVPAPLMSELTSAVSGFLNNGGSVTVGMRPTSPTTVGDMMTLVEQEEPDFERLGISVSAEPAE